MWEYLPKEEFEKMQANGDVYSDNFTVDGLKFDYPKRMFEVTEVDYSPQTLRDFYSKEELKSIRKSLREHNLQDDGRVMISVICDGTLYFLMTLLFTLTVAGCTDIKTTSRPATGEEIPKDKPFCRWYYAAEGTLPEKEEQKNAKD